MAHATRYFREDEHELDFSDTTDFAFERWHDAIASMKHVLSNADWEKVSERRDWLELQADIRKRVADPRTSATTRKHLNHMQLLPRALFTLVGMFENSIKPLKANYDVLWGIVWLNTKMSCVSTDKLARTAGWSKRLRSELELFNRCLEACDDEQNEARLKMIDVFEYILQMFGDSVKHLRLCPTDADATRGWRALEAKINDSLVEMRAAVKHLDDIASYTQANHQRQVKLLMNRHGPNILPDEHAKFPVMMLPRSKNEDFFGRVEELAKINAVLEHKDASTLRTYTIYGRRGVGKTDIALEYAHTNPARFDAIFWCQCETSSKLRQSFTDMAVALELPGADRNGHHEENQDAVLRWLKRTSKRWLLIFDNAEHKQESILRGYWPVGASGSILITSRTYYNFMNDATRQGNTVKLFNDKQSWELLMKLLGPNWEDLDKNDKIKVSEETAGRALLKSLNGLALAIQQAAELIKSPNIGDRTIANTLKAFLAHKEALPDRHGAPRSDIVKSLDSLWSITFNALTRRARDLLSVLSLLSPDGILIDLFLPKSQNALDGKLAFCKQHPDQVDPQSQAFLSSVITVPPPLQEAIDELVKWKLITQEGRELWAHRVVQEAMNFHSAAELQAYFDSAVALVHEAFPKPLPGGYQSSQWASCQSYISHGAHLSRNFGDQRPSGLNVLQGSPKLVDLLYHCAWYLYEISDYDVCLRITETARLAFADNDSFEPVESNKEPLNQELLSKDSLQYANLCHTAGSAYYELNKLVDCRREFEMFLQIQESLLGPDELELSKSYHCMGNLEHASDSLEEAMAYYNRAISIRKPAGDQAAETLALTYLCMSRVHYREQKYDLALKVLVDSEALFVRTAGANTHFMAHVHYAYGNIEFAHKRWVAAKRAYEASLKIALETAAIHPITAAAYYSLGCVEHASGRTESARGYLEKALMIAGLRSPHRDDGTMARILWKKSKVLDSDTLGTYLEESKAVLRRAEVAKALLTASGEGALVFAIDEEGNVDAEEEEESYDVLVPGFFR